MAEGGLLAIFAHPDDETFGVGGTMARYAAQGVPVTMVCATRGEVGEIAPGTGATPENLGQYREQELRDAMAVLGVSDVRFLGFRDSGMAGTEDNNDQRAFARAHPDAVTHMLVKIIRETRPRVIVTWDPSGGYGHPDHIAAHKHATAAHYAASDANRFPSAGPAFKPEALYWLSFPMGEFARLAKELRDRGLPSFEAPGGDEALAQMELERYEPNAVLDVRPQYRQKVEALGTHRTQMGPDDIFMTMPDDLRSQFFAREYFYRVDPPLPEGVELEDLFASL